MRSLKDSEIRALIRLLGDEEPTAGIAQRILMESRVRALPFLEEAVEDPDPQVRGRVRQILEAVRIDRLVEQFRNLSRQPDERMSLEDGAFLLAEYAYPGLKPAPYRAFLDRLAQDAHAASPGSAPPEARLAALHDVLFSRERFQGNRERYYEPENSYINRVLDRRLGIPISLSTVYLLVAERLGLRAWGIGMPGHFIVQVGLPGRPVFVDPFHGGRVMDREECARALARNGFEFREQSLRPATPRHILARSINNLIQIHTQQHEAARAEHLRRFLNVLLKRP